MSKHLTFKNNDTEVWCPTTEYYEAQTYYGDKGPSEPYCSGCKVELGEHNMEEAHHVLTGKDWNCHGELVIGGVHPLTNRCLGCGKDANS